jgi:hypothetical protein
MLMDTIKAAAGSLRVTNKRAAMLIQQTVMYGWLMNPSSDSRPRVTAEDAWGSASGLGG